MITDSIQAKRGLRQGDPLSPLLFVLVMEYLHRTLQKMGRNPDFEFHSKCEQLKIVNLSCTDDLLVFTRRDNGSVTLALNTMKDFAEAIGLHVNPSKCRAYFGNGIMR